jgi:hypothetical protein
MDRADRPPRPTPEAATRTPRPTCVVGETLREVRVLSEAEWEAIPPEARPAPAEFFPGLGWVVAGPVGGTRPSRSSSN